MGRWKEKSKIKGIHWNRLREWGGGSGLHQMKLLVVLLKMLVVWGQLVIPYMLQNLGEV